jgi:glutaredoxin 3
MAGILLACTRRGHSQPSLNRLPGDFMPKVVVYSTAFCPYCVRAKMLLEHKGVSYEEIRVDQDRDRMMEMMQRSQRRTVPQIFIDDYHVGGFDDMSALDVDGKLNDLLGIDSPEEDAIT